MNEKKVKCASCGFIFQETSTMLYRRLNDNAPQTCQSCYRIANAEQRATKRQIEEKFLDTFLEFGLESKRIKELWIAYKKFGKLTVTFLQRKLQIEFEIAEKLSKKCKEIHVP